MFPVSNLLFKAQTSKQQRQSVSLFPTKHFPHLHQSRFPTLTLSYKHFSDSFLSKADTSDSSEQVETSLSGSYI